MKGLTILHILRKMRHRCLVRSSISSRRCHVAFCLFVSCPALAPSWDQSHHLSKLLRARMRSNGGKYLAFSSLPPFPARRGRKRVLIEGAGIAGLSLAYFLKRFLPETYKPLIVEKRKEGEVSVHNGRGEHGGRKRGYTASK